MGTDSGEKWFPKENLGYYKGEIDARQAKQQYAFQWTIKNVMFRLNCKG